MADRQAGLKVGNFSLAGMCFLLTLTLFGCKTVELPDLASFDLGLTGEKSLVTIKSSYNKVNIRPTPSTNQPAIATVNGGDQLNLVEERGNWFRVTFYDTKGDEQKGWIYKFLIEGYDKPAQEASESKTRETPTNPARVDTTTHEASSPENSKLKGSTEEVPKNAGNISVL